MPPHGPHASARTDRAWPIRIMVHLPVATTQALRVPPQDHPRPLATQLWPCAAVGSTQRSTCRWHDTVTGIEDGGLGA